MCAKTLYQQTLSILTRLNGLTQAKEEYEDIKSSLYKHSGKILSFGIMILVIGMLLSAFQQLVGIQVMMYYAPEIIKNMGSSVNSAMFQTILVGAVNVVFTVIAIYTVDKISRKPLLLIGSLCMMVLMFVLGITFLTNHMGVLSLISVLGFVGAFAFSWGPVTWVLLSEMFPNTIQR